MDNALTQRMPERVSLEFLFSFWLVLCKFVVHTCKDREKKEERIDMSKLHLKWICKRRSNL